MANLGNFDDVGEATLASATAAIITARWSGPASASRSAAEAPVSPPAPPRGSASVPSRVDDGSSGSRIFAAAPFDPVPEIFGSNGTAATNGSNGNGNGNGNYAASPAYPDDAYHRQAGPAQPEGYQHEAPQYEAPQYEAPQYEAPQYEAPQYEAPQYEAPQYEEYEASPGAPAAAQVADRYGPPEYGDYGDHEYGVHESGDQGYRTADRGDETEQAPGAPPAAEPAGLVVPAPRAGEPDDGDFAGSLVADLAYPEPVLVEPYEPGFITSGGGAYGAAPGPEPTNAAPTTATPTSPDPMSTAMGSAAVESAAVGSASVGAVAVSPGAALARALGEAVLPQRVPGVPDVPDVPLRPNDPLLDPGTVPEADGSELSRIATYLRDDTNADPEERPDGFDLNAVLEAVRGVVGVRGANLRYRSGAGHTLRIEFDDDADEGQVTREVAKLLRETMGLAADLNPAPGTLGAVPPPTPPRSEPIVERRSAPVERGPGVTDERGSHPLPPPRPGGAPAGPRIVLDHVQVTTLGLDASVEVRLMVPDGTSDGRTQSVGRCQGPAVDAYLLRLAAGAAGDALDQLLVDRRTGVARARCFVEHVAVVPFGSVEVAVVVLLLVWGTQAEQHSGSAIVAGDPRQAVVRATLAAVNRRLQSLLG